VTTPLGVETGVAAYLDRHADEMVVELQETVEHETPSDDPELLALFAGFLAQRVTSVGATKVEVLDAPHEGAHVRATFGDEAAGRPILLLTHFDTVWPRGTLETMPFTVADGVARGPGAFDMKAGLVQALWAIRALLASGDDLPPVVLFSSCDEEIGSPHARSRIQTEARGAVAVLVPEPSMDGSLKTARKGVARYTVEVTGRAAHAGLNPVAGVSAINELCRFALELDALSDEDRLKGTSVNVGVIRGGTRFNVVPAEASVELDVRAATAAGAERVQAFLDGLTTVHPEARVRVSGGPLWPPMERTPKIGLLVERARLAAARLGFPLDEVAVGAASDGNLCAAAGAAVLDGLGAVGGGAHAADEHVVVAEMPRRAALLALLIQDYDAIREELARLET